MQEVQSDHRVGSEWDLPFADHKKSHDTWFSSTGLAWSCKPKLDDFPEYKAYKESFDSFKEQLETKLETMVTDEADEDEYHVLEQAAIEEWHIHNKYFPEGFKEKSKELSEEIFDRTLKELGIERELDEKGNPKPLVISKASEAHKLQEAQQQVQQDTERLYKQMFEEQGCQEVPEDPKVIDKDLRFKLIAVKDDVEYMECLDATGACTSKPPLTLKFGGGLAIFIGWIEPGSTEVRYYEAYPIWNGNGKFGQDKVMKAIKNICYDIFPDSMRPMFKALLKKAGFKSAPESI